jgi:phytanoyl-CoA hydroxylase
MRATAELTDERQDRFRTEGWFVVEGLFDEAECDAVVDAIERCALDIPLGDPADGTMSYRPMMHAESAVLAAVATDRRWAPVILPLLGTGDARLYWDQGVCKPPRARTELPWHQDNGYTPLAPEEYVSCWLALSDATPANGCLQVLPGSHLRGTVPHHDGPGPFRVGRDDAAGGTSVPARRGDVVVFSSLMMHRSGPNETDAARRAWIIQFCSKEVRSALSGKLLDDRLLVADEGRWLAEPVRQRPFDLLSVLGNYDRR